MATTVFRWTLSIAAGFTAMALMLFGFIYWQTAVHESQKIDKSVVLEARLLRQVPSNLVAARLMAWLADDPHGLRYGGLFRLDGHHLAGNLKAYPKRLPVDGRAQRAVFKGIDRDEDGDDPEVVRAVAVAVDPARVLVIGYDDDELEDVQDIIRRAASGPVASRPALAGRRHLARVAGTESGCVGA